MISTPVSLNASHTPLNQVSGHGTIQYQRPGDTRHLKKWTNDCEVTFYAFMREHQRDFYEKWMCRHFNQEARDHLSHLEHLEAPMEVFESNLEQTPGNAVLIMENSMELLPSKQARTILDVKMGTCLYSPRDTDTKRAYKIEKAAQTSTGSLGLRLCGYYRRHIIHDQKGNGTEQEYRWDKRQLQRQYGSLIHDFFLEHWSPLQLTEMHRQLMILIGDYEKHIAGDMYPHQRWYSSSLLWVDDYVHDPMGEWRGCWRWIDFAQSSIDWRPWLREGQELPEDGVWYGLQQLDRILKECVHGNGAT